MKPSSATLRLTAAAVGSGLLVFAGTSVLPAHSEPIPQPSAVRGSYYGCVYSRSGLFAAYYAEFSLDDCTANACTGHGYSALAGSFAISVTIENGRMDGTYRYTSRPEAHGGIFQQIAPDGSLTGNFGSSRASTDGDLIAGEVWFKKGVPPIGGADAVRCERRYSFGTKIP